MGLYDRDYTQDNTGYGGSYREPMRMGPGMITPVVKWLLIINGVVFLLSLSRLGSLIYGLFQVDTTHWTRMLQPWRLVTYQFLHSRYSLGHIIFNMLMLFFMGPILERHWGSKRFIYFYLTCGVVGGLSYILTVAVNWLDPNYLVGASGSILGVLVACAILFPQITVYFWGIFPIPIRWLAIFSIGASVFVVMQGREGVNAGGQAAHLGGVAAGAIYVYLLKHRLGLLDNFQQKRRQRQRLNQQALQQDVDSILDKVREQGMHSLSRKERATLKKATEAEQRRNQRR